MYSMGGGARGDVQTRVPASGVCAGRVSGLVPRRHMAPCAPVLRFGVILDVQYCDTEDGMNFDGTEKRHYRGALDCLAQAVEHWNTLPDLQFVAQLGDLLDGQCAALGQRNAAPATVMALFGQCHARDVYHCIGNHDLYNFDRPTLARYLRTARGPGGTGYYRFRPVPRWTVLVLDPYEEAIIGNPPDSVGYAAALEALQRHNPNDVLKGGGLLQGLEGPARRWLPYNGALGARRTTVPHHTLSLPAVVIEPAQRSASGFHESGSLSRAVGIVY